MAEFNQIREDIKNRMDKTLESLKSDFSGLRAGRAHASLLDGIMVESYGSMVPCRRSEPFRCPMPGLCRSVFGTDLSQNLSRKQSWNRIWG